MFCVKQMIENQEELRAALERNRVHKEQIKHLEKQTSERDGLTNERCALQIEELQSQVSPKAAVCFIRHAGRVRGRRVGLSRRYQVKSSLFVLPNITHSISKGFTGPHHQTAQTENTEFLLATPPLSNESVGIWKRFIHS